MEFKEKVKMLREEKGISPEQMSNELDKLCLKSSKIKSISHNTIRGYEDGTPPKSIEKIITLANYFNVSLEYLLYDNVENKFRENLDIGNALELSDASITAIKNSSKNALNVFLEKIGLPDLIILFDQFVKINYIIKNDIPLLKNILLTKNFILKEVGRKNVDSLIDFFNESSNSIDTIDNFAGENYHFNASDSCIDLLTGSFIDLKKSIFSNAKSPNLNVVQYCFDDFEDIFQEVCQRLSSVYDLEQYKLSSYIQLFILKQSNIKNTNEILEKYLKVVKKEGNN